MSQEKTGERLDPQSIYNLSGPEPNDVGKATRLITVFRRIEEGRKESLAVLELPLSLLYLYR